jgi:bidirectional [NiFe] hydrogenase diaphorase subunit
MMGSGGMVVLGETTDMVARSGAPISCASASTRSCGKCVPCRAGTVQLEQPARARSSWPPGQEADLDQLLKRLCPMVRSMSLCGLGQSAPKPVLSTLRYFRGDYLALRRPPHASGRRLRPDGTAPAAATPTGANG